VQKDVSRDQVELGHVTDPSGKRRVVVIYGTISYCKGAWCCTAKVHGGRLSSISTNI
jgi:hypothetical protein